MNSSPLNLVIISEGFLDFFIGLASITQKLKLIRLDPDLKSVVLVNTHELDVKLRFELDINKALENIFELNKNIGEILLILEFFESYFKGLFVVFVDHVKTDVFFKDLFKSNDVGIVEFFYN